MLLLVGVLAKETHRPNRLQKLIVKPYMILIAILMAVYSDSAAQSLFKVLHYSETSGFDHNTRSSSFNFFNALPNIIVDRDSTGLAFNSLSSLLNYELIIFSNTSGDQLLDSAQRSHFEQYINQGRSLMGIHAATDTYRHSTANGSNTGSWDFYAETMGGSVQQNPNHVSGTPSYPIRKLTNHDILNTLPDPWQKNEEYYYWENGYLDTNNIDLLQVDQTVGPNNQVNIYDSSRTVAWIKTLPSGSRIFYTSLGHLNSNFTTDTLFQRLVENGMLWCLNIITDLKTVNSSFSNVYPNPFTEQLTIELRKSMEANFQIFDGRGKLLKEGLIFESSTASTQDLNPGAYLLKLFYKEEVHSILLIKE